MLFALLAIVVLAVASFSLAVHLFFRLDGRTRNRVFDACQWYHYSYDRECGIVDPPVELQERRFDVQRGLKAIRRRDKVPRGLDKYTVDGETTGVYERWSMDNVTLGEMCSWLNQCAWYCLREANPAEFRARCLAVVCDFVPRYATAVEGKFNNVFPWGTNWYEFSISSTLMLFHYIMIERKDAKKREFAARLILKIIDTPKRSLGVKRDQANSIYMALPYLAAHIVLGTENEATANPDYAYVVDYIKFPVVDRRKNEGLYIDFTYITHGNCLAYGYLHEMTVMSLPLVEIDNMMRNFMLDYKKCCRILNHPSLPYGPIGFHTRAFLR